MTKNIRTLKIALDDARSDYMRAQRTNAEREIVARCRESVDACEAVLEAAIRAEPIKPKPLAGFGGAYGNDCPACGNHNALLCDMATRSAIGDPLAEFVRCRDCGQRYQSAGEPIAAREVVKKGDAPAPLWTRVLKCKGGHRYFTKRGTSRIFVADDSGATPDRTDDGEISLDRSKPATIVNDSRRSFGSLGVYVDLPAFDRNGKPCAILENLIQGSRVIAAFGLKVEVGTDLAFACVTIANALDAERRAELSAKPSCDDCERRGRDRCALHSEDAA
jgi:DNA-directed RNA polymerase subunit M/transcription elongation factor TFIIS